MIPKKLYCRKCGKKMVKTKDKIDDMTLILFTCPNIKYAGDSLEHDQSSFELSPKQAATWEGA